MKRYVLIKERQIECYHIEDGKHKISTIRIINHNLDALKFAHLLVDAAIWYEQVAKGEIEPLTKGINILGRYEQKLL